MHLKHVKASKRACQGDVLPLRAGKIAIIGSVADSESYDPNGVGQGLGSSWHSGDYYSGGGSGHLTGQVIKPLAALKARAALAGVEVVVAASDNATEAAAAAAAADVAIVVVGATSGESVDREDLKLERLGGSAYGPCTAYNQLIINYNHHYSPISYIYMYGILGL